MIRERPPPAPRRGPRESPQPRRRTARFRCAVSLGDEGCGPTLACHAWCHGV